MSQVVPFPVVRAVDPPAVPADPATTAMAPRLPATGGRRGEYALADVARGLNLLHFSVRTIIDKLRSLARHDGMPLPRTPRIVSGEPLRGPLIIYSHSRWDAGEFDAWLEARSTPTGGAALPVPQPVRQAMASRAQALAAAGGR